LAIPNAEFTDRGSPVVGDRSERRRNKNRSTSARPRAEGSCPPLGPLANTSDNTPTARTRACIVGQSAPLPIVAAAHRLVPSRNQSWRIGEKSS
jgi:hypothetical protein